MNAIKSSLARKSSVGIADTISILNRNIQLTVGLRYQNVLSNNYDTAIGNKTSGYDENAITPAVALLIKPWSNVSVYGNWIQGLQQGVIVGQNFSNAGKVFPPFKSTQYEAGIKADWGSFITTASIFQIEQPSAITEVSTNTMVLDGERRNRGLELNISGEPVDGFRLLGGVMLLDSLLTKTQGGLTDGWRAPFAPKLNLNLGAEWDLPFLPGLTLNGRVVYTTDQYIDTTSPRRQLPDWTRVDVGLRYAFDNTNIVRSKFVARLNVENLFDKNYWESGNGANSLTIGMPRIIRLSLTADF
ncbi:MAG: TonB-dependent receptor [Nitrosomonas sp.]|nr:TonB-dependent receptor [Nitrosomonas sp.]